VKVVLLLAVVIGVVLGLRASGIDLARITPERVRDFVLSFGAWAPVMYLAVYGQPVVPLPASLMSTAGGMAFGPVWGTMAALGGATMRACTQFGVARLLGREAVAKLLRGRAARLDQAVGERGFKTVLLIRLIPNVPFDMQNYALGFSTVRPAPYAVATFLGIIPGCFAFAYLGHSLTDPNQLWKAVLAMLCIVGLSAFASTRRRRQP
jgi:uncharacterized membrane protein YdjX (TVP38/TMEM64 family)